MARLPEGLEQSNQSNQSDRSNQGWVRQVWLGVVLMTCFTACAATNDLQPNIAEAQAFFDEGEAQYAKHEYAKAMEKYNLALQSNPEFADAYYKRGRCRIELIYADVKTHYIDALDAAVTDFELAVRFFPEFFEAYYSRAVANAMRARYKDAAFDLVHFCLKIRPQDRDSNLLLAKVYETGFDGKQAEAFKYYEKYLQLGGTDVLARARYEELKAMFQTTKQVDENEKKASEQFERSMKLVGEGKADQGLKGLTELLSKYPNTQFVKDRQKLIAQLIEQLTPRDKK